MVIFLISLSCHAYPGFHFKFSIFCSLPQKYVNRSVSYQSALQFHELVMQYALLLNFKNGRKQEDENGEKGYKWQCSKVILIDSTSTIASEQLYNCTTRQVLNTLLQPHTRLTLHPSYHTNVRYHTLIQDKLQKNWNSPSRKDCKLSMGQLP